MATHKHTIGVLLSEGHGEVVVEDYNDYLADTTNPCFTPFKYCPECGDKL